jgi:hypothetical protein
MGGCTCKKKIIPEAKNGIKKAISSAIDKNNYNAFKELMEVHVMGTSRY